MTNLFAVDDGYAYTKVAWKGKDDLIHTLAIPSRAASGLVLTGFDGGATGGYTTNDEGFEASFTVSPSVPDPEKTEVKDYPFSPLNRVIVHHALRQTRMVTPENALEIGLTVPMCVFYDDDAGQVETDRRRSFDEPVFSVESDSPKKSLWFSAITIYPEAASAYIDFRMNARGEYIPGTEGSVAIVDVGGHTTDVAIMLEGMTIDQAHSGTDPIGVLTLLRAIDRGIEKKHGFRSFVGLAEKALREPGHLVPISAQITDFSDIVNEAKHAIAHKIHQAVQQRIGEASELSAVVFVGGGATVLSSVLKSYLHVHVPEDPHLANARGMLKYMTYLR